MNRVSKISIKDVLSKYVTDDVRDAIMSDIDDASIDEANAVCGMSVLDYFSRYDDSATVIWAADSEGFGKAGDPVYGNLTNLTIRCCIGLPGRGNVVLTVWWDWKDWKDANKRFSVMTNDGTKKTYYAKNWRSAAELAISDGLKDFTVSAWIGKFNTSNSDMTEMMGKVSCGAIV